MKDNKKFGDYRNRARIEYIHEFFMRGNRLTSPGMAMRRDDFKEILYPLDTAMCNQQDTQMHIKILLNGEIKILDDILVMYRFDPKTSNVSARTDITIRRENMEIERLMDTFLAMKDIDLLQKIFAKEIAKLGINPQEDMIEYFLGRMALLSPVEAIQVWGYHKVMESYSTKENAKRLKDIYDFDFKTYLDLAHYTTDKTLAKYRKYKKLFKILLYMNIALCGVIIWLIW